MTPKETLLHLIEVKTCKDVQCKDCPLHNGRGTRCDLVAGMYGSINEDSTEEEVMPIVAVKKYRELFTTDQDNIDLYKLLIQGD